MTRPFADRLADAVRSKDSCLVVGLDPVLERLPAEVRDAESSERDPRRRAAGALQRFGAAVLEAVAPFACAVKPQLAFYERWGPPGLQAYEAAVTRAHELGLLVIADAKRGDIGSTAQAYAKAFLDPGDGAPAADAITVNPLLGHDGVKPFVDMAAGTGAGVFVLVRTSNPSAGELQDLCAEGAPVHEHLARLVDGWGRPLVGECGYSSVGAVVGATSGPLLAHLRSLLPHAWLLLPGVGAQGARPDDVRAAFDPRGLGAVVNASRSILFAYEKDADPDWRSAIGRAAKALRDELRVASGSSTRRAGASSPSIT